MASVLHPTEPTEGPLPEEPPEFDEATKQRIETVAEEKRRALAEPGASWRDWLFFQAFKWWLVIAILVVDSWIAAAWVEVGSYVGLVLSLVVAIYFEFLLFQYLWYRPDPEAPRLRKGEFRPTWVRPVEVGRWTPEAVLAKRGVRFDEHPDAVDPKEFL